MPPTRQFKDLSTDEHQFKERSDEPAPPAATFGNIYLDDGTNTAAATQGLRAFQDGNYVDLGAGIAAPASSTDNALVRFDETTGSIAQNSGITLDDNNQLVSNEGGAAPHFKINNNIKLLQSTSILTGNVISINADTTKFDLSAGSICIINNATDPDNATFTLITHAGITAIPVPDVVNDDVTFIGIKEVNTGLPVGATATAFTATINGVGSQTAYVITKATDTFTPEETRTIAVIGDVSHADSVIAAFLQTTVLSESPSLNTNDFFNVIGAFNIDGNVYSDNGANLNIDKTAGSSFALGRAYLDTEATRHSPNITTDASETALTFAYLNQDGSGGWDFGSDVTVIDPDQYDDGTGILAAVGTNNWTIQYIIYKPGLHPSPITRIQYGQTQYNSFALAEDALISGVDPLEREPLLRDTGVLRAALIIRESTTDLSTANAVFFIINEKFGTGVSGGSISTTTLQQAYKNSTIPQISIDTVSGAFTIQGATTDDTDDSIDFKNNAGTTTANISADGEATFTSITSTTIDASANTIQQGAQAIKTITDAGQAIAVGADRNIIVAAFSGTADDLIEITGLSIGESVWLIADAGDTITVKHNDGGATVKLLMRTGADTVLTENNPMVLHLFATNKLAQSL